MTPLDDYQEQCKQGLITENSEQLLVVIALQKIYHDLVQAHQMRSSLFAKLRKPKTVKGLYLWGGVGIGKTFLLNSFFNCIPFPEKMRIHFHAFMKWVHLELKLHQGKKDPLHIIAKKIAKKTQLICFDEFIVKDIADAMILGRLFNALFAQQVCLIATSNIHPDDLYKDGLQRRSFLPTIALIKQHTQVMHLPIHVDYRLRHLNNAGVFFSPDNEEAEENMQKCFALLTKDFTEHQQPIELFGRQINIKKQAGKVIWFDYNDFCTPPRSHHDYLAIAEKYQTVFISHVPAIPASANDRITLFIRMIDVFYDARVRLVLTTETDIDKLYSEGLMLFDYQRTASRLKEMQSEGYFERS